VAFTHTEISPWGQKPQKTGLKKENPVEGSNRGGNRRRGGLRRRGERRRGGEERGEENKQYHFRSWAAAHATIMRLSLGLWGLGHGIQD